MKILHVCEYTIGGISTYLNQVIMYQQKEHDVYIVLSKYNSEKLYEISDGNIFYYDYYRHPKYFIGAIKKIKQTIDDIQPDIIHIHSTFAGLFARLPLFVSKKKAKVIYCSHGWSFLIDTSSWKKKIYLFIEKVLSYKTDVIINVSNYEYQESIKLGLPESKSIMIYNGVAPTSSISEVNLPLDKNKINLLFVGRFDKSKGIDIVLDVFEKNNFENIHLYTVGSKVLNSENPTNQIINVTNIGWINNTLIDSYYKLFDAVIIPSRWEGFGLVAIEAMRNSKAIIASNRGALPELVNTNLNGYIFDLGNPTELVQILNNLDKEVLKTMGKNGYSLFCEKFTSEVMNNKIIEAYKSEKYSFCVQCQMFRH